MCFLLFSADVIVVVAIGVVVTLPLLLPEHAKDRPLTLRGHVTNASFKQ